MVHSVSPGWTTCGTPAAAGAAARRAVVNASPSARDVILMTWRFPRSSEGDSRYGGLHNRVQKGGGYPLVHGLEAPDMGRRSADRRGGARRRPHPEERRGRPTRREPET